MKLLWHKLVQSSILGIRTTICSDAVHVTEPYCNQRFSYAGVLGWPFNRSHTKNTQGVKADIIILASSLSHLQSHLPHVKLPNIHSASIPCLQHGYLAYYMLNRNWLLLKSLENCSPTFLKALNTLHLKMPSSPRAM